MSNLPVKYVSKIAGITTKSQNFIFPENPDPTQNSIAFWGNSYRAIMGRNNGKFRANPQSFFPINIKNILLDTAPGSLMNVAMQVPHLNTVISTMAELFSMMEIKHVDKNGKDIKNSEVLKFLQNPNPLQTQEQILYEFFVMNAVYNKTLQYKLQGISRNLQTIPDCLWILPSGWMKINVTGKLYRQTDINNIIENFVMYQDSVPYKTEDVIYMTEGIGNNILNPTSRIEALQIPLSNIVATLKSRNIIITERGMIGFISSDASQADSDGQLPFDKDERIRMEKEFQNQYALDGMNGHVGFTHAKVKWTPMTYVAKELQLLEGTEMDFGVICDSFRADRDVFSSTKGATFENKSAGMKSTITNGVQPLANKLMNQWTKNFTEQGSGEKLIASYMHLPAMKEDERLAAQGKLYMVQAGQVLFNSNIIDAAGFAEFVDVEMTGSGEAPVTPAATLHIAPPPVSQ